LYLDFGESFSHKEKIIANMYFKSISAKLGLFIHPKFPDTLYVLKMDIGYVSKIDAIK